MANGDIPEDANGHCPGTQSDSAGKSDACQGKLIPMEAKTAMFGSPEVGNQNAVSIASTALQLYDYSLNKKDLVVIAESMANVKHKIFVLSGKGGVGKSTFSAQLSIALAAMDFQIGLLDIDICGPSIPKMLGLEGQGIHKTNLSWSPVYVDGNIGVISIRFMLPGPNEAVILRGPRKTGLIKNFLKDVYWNELDFLVVDAPPGTSDEQISIVQCLGATGIDGAIIVLGVVENMSGLCQPLMDFKFMRMIETGEHIDISEWVREYIDISKKAPELQDLIACNEVFDSSSGGAEKMCREMDVPFLGKVPLDPQLCKAAEEGRSCFIDNKCQLSAPAVKIIIEKLIENNRFSRMLVDSA
uniref:Cytosolic Fe-S cluster assembly factor NBP35 n=1 Tax=Quercus lobata TaxID=97700 RepID=A0A7N2LCN0_QUELO